jgi:hypothetical protein
MLDLAEVGRRVQGFLYFTADVSHGYADTASVPCTYYVAALIMRPRGPSRPRGPAAPR